MKIGGRASGSALPGRAWERVEACMKIGGRASGSALPGRAWERVERVERVEQSTNIVY